MSQERHPTEDLPAYALGALEREEREAIALHLETCTACARDLAQFQEALFEAAAVGAVNVDPPSDLRTRIVLRHRGARGPSAKRWGERLIELLRTPLPAAVPLVLAILSLAAIGAVIGLVVGLANGLGARSLGVLVLGALAGLGLGYLTAAAPGPRVGIAIAIAVGLVTWIAFMVRALASAEFDTERLKDRYIPVRSIEAAKETMEWAREQMPLSKRS